MLQLLLDHIFVVIGFVLAVLGLGHIVRQRRSAAATTLWLFVILLFPYLGVPLYLVFGGRKTRRAAAGKQKLVLPSKTTVPDSSAVPMDRLLRNFGLPGATAGNRLALCRNGEEVYKRLMEAIDSAEHSIYLLTFVFAQDEVGRSVVERLARRAREGVRVRVLLDSVGSLHTHRRFFRSLTRAGGKVAFFVPVLHRPFRGHSNLRNHRKLVVFDENTVIAGGTNITAEYIGPEPRPDRWKDLSFVLSGPAVAHFAEIFRSDWHFASGESLTLDPARATVAAGGSVVQLVPSGPDVTGDPLYDAVLTALFNAKKRLWFVTPYFVPDETLATAFLVAAHRCIDLKLIVPARSNHPVADLARGTYLREIQEAGGTVLLFADGMVHAKVMLMDDDLAVIGSANLDMRSFFLNYECALFTYDRESIAATEDWIGGVAERCTSGVVKAGAFRDVVEGVVRLIGPIL
jgi:cardiolipin synthase